MRIGQNKRIIRLLCIIMMFSLIMCACSNRKGDADVKVDEKDSTEGNPEESVQGKSVSVGKEQFELSKPEYLNIFCTGFTNSINLTWAKVSDANKYELDYGDTPTIVLNESSFSCNSFEEGHIYNIRVRAIHEDGNHVDYSDWLEKSYEVPVNLSAPCNIQKDLDGSCLHLCWDETKGATGYEIKNGLMGEKVTEPWYDFYGLKMGESYSLVIRALKEVEDRVYYSDWSKISYTVPVIDYSNIDYDEATLLDYDHLIEWGKKNEFNQSISTENWDGEIVTVVDLSCKDEKYEGAWGWLREKGAKIEAGLETAYDSMVSSETEKIKSDFISEIQIPYLSKVKGAFSIYSSGGIRKYIEEFDEEAANAGNWGFIEGVINAFTNDTDKHYRYYYDNKSEGAVFSKNLFVRHIGDNHETEKYNKSNGYTKDTEGFYYKTSKSTGQDYIVSVKKTEKFNMNYWEITVNNFRMR